MAIYMWVVFIFLSLMAIFPLTHFDLFNVDRRYKYFKYVSIILVIWSGISFLRYLVTDSTILYYLTLAIYPLLYLLTITLLFAIFNYLKKSIPKPITGFLWIFFVVNAVVSFTNDKHQLVLKVLSSDNLTFQSFRTLDEGIFFHIHTFFSYIIMVTIGYMLVKKLYRNVKKNEDYYPFLFVVIGIVLGIGLNFFHIFVYTFTLDPTFMVFVIFISLLYYVFYMRDLKLILGVDRNVFILNNLREKYVLVDENNIVVDASAAFIELFNIKLDEQLSFDELQQDMSKKAIIYEDPNELDSLTFNDDKLYFNMQSKRIHLPFFKYSGNFYLFYDDTANQKYIYSIQYIKTHDLMTNLFNRNYLEEIRDDLDESSQHYHVVLFDLDGLKIFNDHLGHEAGDRLLQRFSKQLLNISNKEDIIPIRLGGDEFLLIVINKNITAVEQLIKILDQQNKNKPILDIIRYSYGIATNKNSNKKMDKVLSEADQNMYTRKSSKDNYKERLKNALIKEKKKVSVN